MCGPDAGFGAGFHHVLEGRFDVEVPRAEGIRGREQNHGRIAAHHIGDIVGSRPARIPSALRGVVDERLHHVGFALGLEERLKLDGVAIDIPIGEVGVLRRLFRTGERMHLVIEADVFAVFIAEEIGRKKRVVEAGIEDGALVRGAAFHRSAVEQAAPR